MIMEIDAPLSSVERQEAILHFVEKKELAMVAEIAEQFSVSLATVRRDLETLQNEGLIERIHGGARRLKQPGTREMIKGELPFYARQESEVAEKRAIARTAQQFLEPEHVILLDSSTTALYFAQAISDGLPLTIITHSAYLPVQLAGRSNLQVISTGGILQPKSLTYLGLEAESMIRHFHVHRAFFGAQGVALQEGCTDSSILEVQLKKMMAEKAHELIVLADHTKLGNISLASYAPFKRITFLVTDEKADPDTVAAFQAEGIEVILAPLNSNHR
jgi:DeoR/GlpR family transcriptional regulator of sugar metabolism